MPPPGFLRALQAIAKDHGAMLLCDEMITGFGRTGLMWGAEHDGVIPDIMTVGKGVGGGFPLSGVVSSDAITSAKPWSNPSFSSSSYGGNPLAAAAGLAALEVILKELAKEGVQPGDRRQFKTVGVVQAFAFLTGADEVLPEHLEVAQHCLWDDPVDQPQKAAQVIARIANPVGMRVTQLLLEAEQVLAAADVRNLADAAKAAAKLAEIDRQLAALKADGRVEAARAYLKDQLKRLKLASIEAV